MNNGLAGMQTGKGYAIVTWISSKGADGKPNMELNRATGEMRARDLKYGWSCKTTGKKALKAFKESDAYQIWLTTRDENSVLTIN